MMLLSVSLEIYRRRPLRQVGGRDVFSQLVCPFEFVSLSISSDCFGRLCHLRRMGLDVHYHHRTAMTTLRYRSRAI